MRKKEKFFLKKENIRGRINLERKEIEAEEEKGEKYNKKIRKGSKNTGKINQ